PLAIRTRGSKRDDRRRTKAPVDWVAGAPTLATISTVAMIKNPLHPAAAQLLIDFYLSLEGQRALAAAGKIPLRRGVKSESPEVDQLMESGSLHVLRPEGGYDRYMKIYSDYLGIR